MNHQYIPHPTELGKCAVCPYEQKYHSSNAPCMNCIAIGPLAPGRMNPNAPEMLLCRDCIARALEIERQLKAAIELKSGDPVTNEMRREMDIFQSPENQERRLNEHKLRELENTAINLAKSIDSTIEVYTDLFNADTMSIIDIKNSIDNDPNIPADKKYDVLAEFLDSRFRRHQELIFEKRNEIGKLGNEQRAIQQYMMTFANKVRAEIREKIKLSDINYTPQAVLLDKVHKNKKTPNKVKLDKEGLAKYSAELEKEFPQMSGINAILQAFCIQKSITPEKAAIEFRTMVKQGLSMARQN